MSVAQLHNVWPTFLSNDVLTERLPGGVMADSALLTGDFDPRVAEPKVEIWVSSREVAERLRPIVEQCQSLLALEDRWDSYAALRPSPRLIAAGLRLCAALSDADTPTPAVVPTTTGGVQFEWFHGHRELEVEVLGEHRFLVVYEDEESGESIERDIVGDPSPISEFLEKLTA